ncbi:MAG: rRNA pseudouridine synthase [Oscillospiraceae bacterium]|nr:rRNA pseudouridine synthase [Oscillospiraceae bacterium]
MEQRLQKLIAASGLCSRRTAEAWIEAGRVTVNGAAASVGQSADPDADEILVDGKPLAVPEQKRYLMLNKPRGYVCTMSDEQGRPTVAELVADCGARVVPVGRLDLDSEGLLLLTNDGAWLQRILHPRYEIDKTYRVTVAGDVRGAAVRLAALTAVDGEPIRPARVSTLREGKETAELEMIIHEGKNRQIRRMCAAVGLHVKRLRRVAEHHLPLGGLPSGKWRDLTVEEVREFDER